jgi:hypothetical protein
VTPPTASGASESEDEKIQRLRREHYLLVTDLAEGKGDEFQIKDRLSKIEWELRKMNAWHDQSKGRPKDSGTKLINGRTRPARPQAEEPTPTASSTPKKPRRGSWFS